MSKTVFLHFKWCKDTAFVSSIQILDCYTFCYTLLWCCENQSLTIFCNHGNHGRHGNNLVTLENYPKRSKHIIVFISILLRTLRAGQSSSPRGPRSKLGGLITLRERGFSRGDEREGVFFILCYTNCYSILRINALS